MSHVTPCHVLQLAEVTQELLWALFPQVCAKPSRAEAADKKDNKRGFHMSTENMGREGTRNGDDRRRRNRNQLMQQDLTLHNPVFRH